VKIQTEPLTPKERLTLEPTSSTPKKKPYTRQQIMVMGGGDEGMEVDVTTQQGDKSIKMESDQFINDQSELDFEQITN
jgi:hypothetical protein